MFRSRFINVVCAITTVLALAAWPAYARAVVSPDPVLVLEGHTAKTCCVVYSPNGKLIATAAADGTVRVWDAATGKQKACFGAGPPGAPGPVRTFLLRFVAGGKMLAASVGWDIRKTEAIPKNSIGGVRAWDLESEKLAYTIDDPCCWQMAMSPDGKMLATCGYPEDTDIRLWDAETGKKIGALSGRQAKATDFCFSPDGKQLAVGTTTGAVEFWDPAARKLLVRFRAARDGASSLAFSPDGKTLVLGAPDGRPTYKIFDVEDLDHIVLRDAVDYMGGHLTFSVDGKYIRGVSAGSVRVHSSWSGALRRIVVLTDDHVTDMAFSPDGKQAALAGEEKVKIWNFSEE